MWHIQELVEVKEKKLPKAIKMTSDYLLQPEWSSRMVRRVFSSATTSEKLSITSHLPLHYQRTANWKLQAMCALSRLLLIIRIIPRAAIFHDPYILPVDL